MFTLETPKGPEQVYSSACVPNCWMNCRLYAHVREGTLVQISAGALPDPRYNRVCLRGLSHPQRVYSDERLLHPLVRVGPRGQNQWRQISWEEAFTLLVERLTDIRQRYGSQSVMFAPISGSYSILNGALVGSIHRFANLFGGTLAVDSIDLGLATGETQVVANLSNGMTAWFMGHQPEDIANARTIIAWGTNVTESQVHNWHFFMDAIEQGATLICIDPRYSETAAKAHLWLRPRPGSDAALALSFIQVIIAENLVDTAYVQAHTVGPFLVREDTGLFLRLSDVQTEGDDAYLLWNSDQDHVQKVEAAQPGALRGTFTVETLQGPVIVHPAFELLAREAAAFTPEGAESLTGIDPETVRRVARIYATNGPAFIYAGMGIDRWDNADLVGRALATLGVITHQIGKPGATPLGALMGGTALGVIFTPGVLDEWVAPTEKATARLNFLLTYEAITTGQVAMWVPRDVTNPRLGPRTPHPESVPYPIKAAVFADSNFVSNFPDQNRVQHELFREDRLEFVVTLEMFLTDTARMSDLVLPVTSWFETDDIVGGMHPFIMRQEQTIAPLGECRSDFSIYQELAKRLGLAWGERSPQEWIDQIVQILAETVHDPTLADHFRRDGVARLTPVDQIQLADGHYLTPSGRAEFYAEGVVTNYPVTQPSLWLPVTQGWNPLPHWEPPFEAWHENPQFQRFPLILNQRHSRFRVHSTFYNVPVLREMDPEPVVELNTHEMVKRHLRDGDLVRVFNDRGAMIVKVRTNNAFPDHTCNINKGWQRHQFIGGGYQELTQAHANWRHYNAAFFDVLVQVEAAVPGAEVRTSAEHDGHPHLIEGGMH